MSDFGERLKFLRKEKKLTQTELAKMLNTTQGTVGKWENNKLEPNFETLKKISDVLNVQQGYLLGDNFTEEKFCFVEYPDNIEKMSKEELPEVLSNIREQFINNQTIFNNFMYSGYGLKFEGEKLEKMADSMVEQILEKHGIELE